MEKALEYFTRIINLFFLPESMVVFLDLYCTHLVEFLKVSLSKCEAPPKTVAVRRFSFTLVQLNPQQFMKVTI